MSTYEYKHEGRRFTADTAAMKDAVFVTAQPVNVTLHGMRIPNADVPTVAAELLKAAGQESVIVPKSSSKVMIEADLLRCGEAGRVAYVKLNEDPDALRTIAANYIAIAAHIDSGEAKLQERRDEVIKYLGWGNWLIISPSGRKAIDRIIELEDGKATT